MAGTLRNARMRMMILCWLVYAMTYFGRLNLSVALPGLQASLGVDKTAVGLLGTLFFWCYGIGQLPGGVLGDRVSARRLVFAGLAGSALCNLAFAFQGGLAGLYPIWALNGLCQSLIWSPVVRTIARWTPPEHRGRAVVAVSTSMVGGFALSWGLLGGWAASGRTAPLFLIPSAAMAMTSVAWLLTARDGPEGAAERLDAGRPDMKEAKAQTTASAGSTQSPASAADSAVFQSATVGAPASTIPWPAALRRLLSSPDLGLVILACFAQGIIRDGITLWAPTFLMEAHGMTIREATASSLFLPAMNLGGILLSGWLTERMGRRAEAATALLFVGAMGMLACMTFISGSAWLATLFLGLASGLTYGVNTLLMGVVPLRYAPLGLVSTVAGLLNFLAYMATGFASAFTGWMVDRTGWNGILLTMTLLAAAGSASLLLVERRSTRSAQAREEIS